MLVADSTTALVRSRVRCRDKGGDEEMGELARHALGESVIAKRLAALRARHGDIDVPDDLPAWARALPES